MAGELTAPLPADINPGILGAVEVLRGLGFRTVDSGDGKTHDYLCDRDWPYIVIECPEERLAQDAKRLAGILEDAGIQLGEAPPCGAGGVAKDSEGIRAGTWVIATFCVNDRRHWGIIEVDFLPGDEQLIAARDQ